MRTMANINEIIEDAKCGRVFILCDDEDRENEGDLIVPAQFCTPQIVNFMITYGRGLVVVAITEEKREHLNLKMMTDNNTSLRKTAFTVSVGAKEGITTGISAFDRAKTISVLASPDSEASDLTVPGHVFPVVAHKGGIKSRQGHTEGSIEICRRAGLLPIAVMCEIVNEDGTMARRPQLDIFAKKHGLKIGLIEDLLK